MKYCVLVYDGANLFAIAGPFISRLKAKEWIETRKDSGSYQIVPLWKPNEIEKL